MNDASFGGLQDGALSHVAVTTVGHVAALVQQPMLLVNLHKMKELKELKAVCCPFSISLPPPSFFLCIFVSFFFGFPYPQLLIFKSWLHAIHSWRTRRLDCAASVREAITCA